MKKLCILKAPAKLNLHLQIGEKRKDGFHDINSLFVMVDLYDEINARSLKTGNDCRIIGEFNCSLEDNLIYRTWKEFCRETGEEYGIEFTVKKKIPSFAGLGGGSSDAAAALRVMNLMFETRLDDEHLAEIGSRIGSDVPFFIHAPAALIGGRGERVKKIDSIIRDFVLINPGVEISTGEAYGWLDSSKEKRSPFLSEDGIMKIYRGSHMDWTGFTNDFSRVLKERYSVFSEIETALNDEGAVCSAVTGSGSAVFGLFKQAHQAEKARNSLQNRFKFVQKIKSLDRIPYAILE